MVSGRDERDLLAWQARSLIGCLYDFQRETNSVCVMVVQDDAAILAKVTSQANFDIDTLGVCSSMMFATSRMLVRELGTEGEVAGCITIGTEYHLIVMSITCKVALVTLSRTSVARGLLEYQARAMMPRLTNCLVQTAPGD
jgi:predicted regulator of Ras-like GTPase activity (Roadblock/LC7/MglB family)